MGAMESGKELNLLSFSTNVLLGDFVLAPFFLKLTPWMVTVAVILMVLGLLTIGSIFFTWRLYKERSRQRKDEFNSKGKSQNPATWIPSSFQEGLDPSPLG